MPTHFDPDPNAFYGGGLAVESYDLFAVQNGRMAGDVDFYLELARRQGGPVLELAAGTGRVLVPLATAGFEVVGVDISQPMLDIAAARLDQLGPQVRDRARLVCAAMQDFESEDRFDLALIPARAFQHLIDPADQRATLQRIRARLNAGGRLAINLYDPLLEVCVGTPPAPPPREAVDPTSGRRFRRTCLGRVTDPYAQTTGESLLIEELDAAGAVITRQETSWTLRWSQRQEMAYLLELCGFEVEALHSDFHGAPAAYGREQVWLARAA
jgi:SAM-dependent methyltransferase